MRCSELVFSAALALYFAYYNFCRIHTTLKVTPAMETKIADASSFMPYGGVL
jgi:hypothetical protein